MFVIIIKKSRFEYLCFNITILIVMKKYNENLSEFNLERIEERETFFKSTKLTERRKNDE